jgi:hypothetical protein
MIGTMLESGEVRKRLRQAIETAKRDAAARRAALGDVQKAYDVFLEERATPVLRQVASALKAEGHVFQVLTPAGTVRLQSDREADDFLEIALDVKDGVPIVIGRVSRVQGSQLQTAEQPIRGQLRASDLADEDVLNWVLRVILPFVER